MKLFPDLIGTFSKLTKDAVFYIKPESITILSDGNAMHMIPLMWADIGKEDFFTHYTMDGVDKENNTICLSVSPSK